MEQIGNPAVTEEPRVLDPKIAGKPRMRWDQLISDKRLQDDDSDLEYRKMDIRGPFDRDHDKLVFWSAFRRMLDKCQCFPMTGNAAIHVRLTHSLEVACVGRSLGRAAGKCVAKKHKADYPQRESFETDLGDICCAACLAHDVGNPPFGHCGEDAVRTWWETFSHEYVPEIWDLDLKHFEGNANGFHLLTKTRKRPLNLTCAVLGAYTKYTCCSDEIPEQKTKHHLDKNGYYQLDKAEFEKVATECGLLKVGKCYVRHPLAFLVEAADDISYTIMDLEDAWRHGNFSEEAIRMLFMRIIIGEQEQEDITDEEVTKRYLAKVDAKNVPKNIDIITLRGIAVSQSVWRVASAWESKYDEIMTGDFDKTLLEAGKVFPKEVIKALHSLWTLKPVAKVQTGGFNIIMKLVDLYARSLLDNWIFGGENALYPQGEFHRRVFWTLDEVEQLEARKLREQMRKIEEEKKQGTLSPNNIHDLDIEIKKCNYQLIMLAAIYVCQMTDSFATRLYQELTGYCFPGI